jgi:hypothetical protein
MTTMKTAVEWLYEEFTKTNHLTEDEFYMKFQQAKEMEKEQIVKAYNESFYLRDKPYATAEKYYNETYNK